MPKQSRSPRNRDVSLGGASSQGSEMIAARIGNCLDQSFQTFLQRVVVAAWFYATEMEPDLIW